MKIALTAAGLVSPLDYVSNPVVLVEDGVIAEVSSREETSLPTDARHIDFGNAVLAPGFIDIHIHGSAGYDVMSADTGLLAGMEQFLANHGVTSYLATTVTAPLDLTLRSLERLSRLVEGSEQERAAGRIGPTCAAQLLGIHLEGPFISPKRCGVHEPESLLAPSLALFGRIREAAQGRISMLTMAPELAGAEEVIREAVASGVCVSIGHSDAGTEEVYNALHWGATHATHTFNAMPELHHRKPGLLGVVLSDDRFGADIIADRVHVAPELLRLFIKAKGTTGAVLISDAMSGAGMPDGIYRLGAMEVEVKNQECRINGALAGSLLTLDIALRNMMQVSQMELQAAVRLVTLNPALTIGVAHRKGLVAPGRDADIVVLTRDGAVMKTMVAGLID